MGAMLALLIFVSISYAQTDAVLIKLEDGNILQVELKGVYEQAIYYELLLPTEKGNIYSVPCDKIVNISDTDGNPIDLNCNENTYALQVDGEIKYKPGAQTISNVGYMFIISSGVLGMIINNRELPEDPEDFEDFNDSQKSLSNMQYAALILGGFLLLVSPYN